MKNKSLLVAVILLMALTTACGSAAPAAPTQAGGAGMPAATETTLPASTTPAATDTLMPTSVPATMTPVASPTPGSVSTSAPAGSSGSSAGFPSGSFKPNHPIHTKILVLNADGTVKFLGIVEAGKTAAEPVDTYTLSGDHVTFLDVPGAASVCQKEPGEYTWSFDGSALVFKMVNDDCSERKIDLTNSTWTKQP